MAKHIDAEPLIKELRRLLDKGELLIGIAEVMYAIDDMPDADAEPRWIPVKTRQMTSDERSEWEEMAGEKLEDEDAVFFDCPMPYDGQEVLVCSKYGHVSMDECVLDEYGCGLDVNGDWDCITAWMPIPKPYKEGEEE